jgi:hypothetical protein
MLRPRLLLSAVCALSLSACVTQEQRKTPTFIAPKPPIEGAARVYVLRPPFNEISKRDTPDLLIDGKVAAELSFDSFVDLNLRPGKYQLQLRAGSFESSIWSGSWALKVEANRTYFLSIWNEVTQDTGLVFLHASNKPFVIPWIGEVTVNKALRYEVVSPVDAVPLMTYMKTIKPNAEIFSPAP